MPIILTYATALLLGSLHALETDHMAAVTSFAARRPGLRQSVRFGVRWAMGHGGAILLVGSVLVVLGIQLPDPAANILERLVGLAMIGLGLWTIRGATTLHAHLHSHDGHAHAHVHSHAITQNHDHRHAATAVGMLHGLAGTGAAVALIPVATSSSPVSAVLFLVVFALGTVAGMALYGLLAGLVLGRTADRSVRVARLLARCTGVITMGVGVWWLLR
jgi:sulfite exporter TauE/SafE